MPRDELRIPSYHEALYASDPCLPNLVAVTFIRSNSSFERELLDLKKVTATPNLGPWGKMHSRDAAYVTAKYVAWTYTSGNHAGA